MIFILATKGPDDGIWNEMQSKDHPELKLLMSLPRLTVRRDRHATNLVPDGPSDNKSNKSKQFMETDTVYRRQGMTPDIRELAMKFPMGDVRRETNVTNGVDHDYTITFETIEASRHAVHYSSYCAEEEGRCVSVCPGSRLPSSCRILLLRSTSISYRPVLVRSKERKPADGSK